MNKRRTCIAIAILTIFVIAIIPANADLVDLGNSPAISRMLSPSNDTQAPNQPQISNTIFNTNTPINLMNFNPINISPSAANDTNLLFTFPSLIIDSPSITYQEPTPTPTPTLTATPTPTPTPTPVPVSTGTEITAPGYSKVVNGVTWTMEPANIAIV
jgi:hypothetical protein